MRWREIFLMMSIISLMIFSSSFVSAVDICYQDVNIENENSCQHTLTCLEAKNLGLLTGAISGGTAQIINNANESFQIGLAVYEKVDEIIDNQTLFESESIIIPPMQNATLSVELPNCKYQIDLFCGEVIVVFNGSRYGERKLDFKHLGEPYYCDEFCGDSFVNGDEQCDYGNQNNLDGCRNDCTLPGCGDGVLDANEECDDGNNENGDGCDFICKRECKDNDRDGACDDIDDCPDSHPEEPVDEDGCDIIEFCSKKMCGLDCITADWKDNEDTETPKDCKVVIPLSNGIPQQPRCVPTEFSDMCAG